MSAGTIALTNNSANVTGTGTAFTTDLKANDFIVVIVGGVTYTLGVSATTSATALTLITPYGGPTTTGNAWTAVPNATMVGITAQIAADVSKAIRGLNLDKANWQQVFSGTGTITVTLPDGSTYSGPAWSSITTSLSGKADLVNGAVAVTQGGTGAKTKADAWANIATYGTGAGTAAQGNDSRLNSIDAKGGGTLTDNSTMTLISVNQSGAASGASVQSPPFYSILRGRGINGDPRGAYCAYFMNEVIGAYAGANIFFNGYGVNLAWAFRLEGNGYAPGTWVNGSDERVKGNFEDIVNGLVATLSCRHVAYDKQDGGREVGIIAQDAERFIPDSVMNFGRRDFSNGKSLDDFKSLNTAGFAAAVHGNAIVSLFELVELALTEPDAAKAKIAEYKSHIQQPVPLRANQKVFGGKTLDEMPADTDFTDTDLLVVGEETTS